MQTNKQKKLTKIIEAKRDKYEGKNPITKTKKKLIKFNF